MKSFVIFIILSIPLIYISRRNLKNVNSHGFYRLISWECIAWLAAVNYSYWFVNPFSLKQYLSWMLLIVALVFVVAGILKMRESGKASRSRADDTLLGFEKTTELVDTGIFSYIRHPLYASLIYLTWGIYFKHTTFVLFVISVISTIFLYLTARNDEKECTAYFGEKYSQYMQRTKMFLPYIF